MKPNDDTPWLHIRSQSRWHGEASIVGTKAGLFVLRDGIARAIATGLADAEAFSSDGEGYGVTIARCRTVGALGSPVYFEEVARDLVEMERRLSEPANKCIRAQSREAMDALRWCRANGNPHARGTESRRATTGTGVVHDGPVGAADAPEPP